MIRSELLSEASRIAGRQITCDMLSHALATGNLPAPYRRPDKWYEYNETHLEALLSYCKARTGRKGRPRKNRSEVAA
jgi:hypothetical protein